MNTAAIKTPGSAAGKIETDKKAVIASGIKGQIKAPPSKNEMIRVVAASLLSSGQSLILNPSVSDDALVAMDIAVTLGAEISWEHRSGLYVSGNGNFTKRSPQSTVIYCGDSGLCMRLFAPIVALTGLDYTIDGLDSLSKKPMQNLEKLNAFGVKCETNKGFAPIWIRNKLKSGSITIDEPRTSQFISGLLLALPLCERESVIKTSSFVNKPYIEMTINTLKKFGIAISRSRTGKFRIGGNQEYKPCTISIEGDWAGAAFLLVAGAIAGSITVTGLNIETDQTEKNVLYAISRAGADIEVHNGSVSVRKNRLQPVNFDARQCPNLIPPLVALSSCCEGKSVIHGMEFLQIKESEGIRRLASEFSSLGIDIEVFQDRIEIQGGRIRGTTVHSWHDHRVAMACAVAALRSTGEVIITNAHCVSKSYPSFFEDLDSVRSIL